MATNVACGTRRRRFSAWRLPISPTPRTPTPTFLIRVPSKNFAGTKLKHKNVASEVWLPGSRGQSEIFHDSSQIFQAGCNALSGRNRSCAKLHVLFHHGPTRVSVFNERAKESRKVDIALTNHGENFVLDRFFKSPFIATSLLQYFRVAILDVNEAQLVLVLLRFSHRITVAINAMSGVQTQAHISVRSCVIKKLAFFGSFHVGGDVRMKYEIESKFVGHFFGIGDNFPNVLSLFCCERRAVSIVHVHGKCVSLRRLIVGYHKKRCFERREEAADFAYSLNHRFARARIRHFYRDERSKQL